MIEKLYIGNNLDYLKTLPSNSIDSLVTDPPYGLSKEPNIVEVLSKWLNGESYSHKFKGFMGKEWDSFVPSPEIFKEVYRVLKPGAHGLVFAGTRTQDLMTISLRLAGFEVRDVIEWLYFSGFPKALDVSKGIDKKSGLLGTQAKQWEGWKTQLKPAHEPIILVRKPLSEKSIVDNVLKHGTGAMNIDGCRVPYDENDKNPATNPLYRKQNGYKVPEKGQESKGSVKFTSSLNEANELGRFPANCITLEDDQFYSKFFNISPSDLSKKASKKDRNSDYLSEEVTVNNHPTVKSIELMTWLIKLITPPQGIVLDPFAGSGTTLVAAKKHGFSYIGCEMSEDYAEIIQKRLHLFETENEKDDLLCNETNFFDV